MCDTNTDIIPIHQEDEYLIFKKDDPPIYEMRNGIRCWKNYSFTELLRLLAIYKNEYKMEE